MKIFIVSLLVVAVTAGDLTTSFKKHEKRGAVYGAPVVNGGYSSSFGNGGHGHGHEVSIGVNHGSGHHGHGGYAPSFPVLKSGGYDYKVPSFPLSLPLSHHVHIAGPVSHHVPVAHHVSHPIPVVHHAPVVHHVSHPIPIAHHAPVVHHVAHSVPVAHHAPIVHHVQRPAVVSKTYLSPLPAAVEVPPSVAHHVEIARPVAALSVAEPVHVHHQSAIPVAVQHSISLPTIHVSSNHGHSGSFGHGHSGSFGHGHSGSFGHGHSGSFGHGHSGSFEHEHGSSLGSLSPPSTSYGVPSESYNLPSTSYGTPDLHDSGYSYPTPAKKFTY